MEFKHKFFIYTFLVVFSKVEFTIKQKLIKILSSQINQGSDTSPPLEILGSSCFCHYVYEGKLSEYKAFPFGFEKSVKCQAPLRLRIAECLTSNPTSCRNG